MMKIIILEDNVEHNLKYYRTIINDFKDDYNFIFDFSDRIYDINYLNSFDLIITSNSFHRNFIKPIFINQFNKGLKLTTPVISWNHSMTGPNTFNSYHNEIIKSMDYYLKSMIHCIDPSFYSNLLGMYYPNTKYSPSYYRLNYHYNTPYNPSYSGLTTYFNHWTTDLEDVLEIIRSYKNDPNFNIRLHPAYFTYNDPNNPLKSIKNLSENSYNKFMKKISDYTHYDLSMDDHIDSSSKLIFDGSSGTLVESIIRFSIYNKKSEFILHDITNLELTPVHSAEDNNISRSILRLLGGVVNDNHTSLIINSSEVSGESIMNKLDVSSSLELVNKDLINLIESFRRF